MLNKNINKLPPFSFSSLNTKYSYRHLLRLRLLTHHSTMCHTNVSQCCYDSCQKYDMAHAAEWQWPISRAVDLQPLRGESEGNFSSFV